MYFPCLIHKVDGPATCMWYTPATRDLFVGLSSGNVMQFTVALDYKSVSHVITYSGMNMNRSDAMRASRSSVFFGARVFG